MSAAMVFVSSSANVQVFAQAPKKEKDTKSTSKAASGTVEISEGKDGKFRFFIRNSDNKLLALSMGFSSQKDAGEAVDELKEVLAKAKVSSASKKAPAKKGQDKSDKSDKNSKSEF
ncbi:MAG: hypothetical protein ACKO23_04840, partial [Gemmataceae bacterium]